MRKHLTTPVLALWMAPALLMSAVSGAHAQVSFAPQVSYPTTPSGLRPNGIVAADLDGDGDLDLATANFNSDNVSLLLNVNGSGTFVSGGAFAANTMPADLTAADLDNDGDLDLAVANYDFAAPRMSVLRNNGNGTFQAPTALTLTVRPSGITAADFTGDGLIDLAVSLFDFGGSVAVLRNTGNAAFVVHATSPTGQHSFGLASGDFDGVNGPDLAVANDQAQSVSVLLNSGGGFLANAANLPSALAPSAVAVGDLDDDGDLDVAAADRASTNVFVHWNNGSGAFPTSSSFAAGFGQLSVAIADLDCDGRNDLAVVANQPDQVGVLSYIGSQSFAPVQLFAVDDDPRDVVIRDFDGDGGNDLATANTNASTVSVLFDSATPQLATMTFRAGIRGDNFMNPPPGAIEYASPSPQLATFLAGPNPLLSFDQVPNGTTIVPDRRFGHTFAGLPPNIAGATLIVRARGGLGGAFNDSLSLGFDNVGSFSWSRQLGALLGSPWAFGVTGLFTLDLANLPPGSTDLISKLNADGRLDVYAQDDSGIDGMVLQARVCKRTAFAFGMGPLLRGQPVALNASGVPGSPGQLVLFVASYAGIHPGTYVPPYDTRVYLNAPLFLIGFGYSDNAGNVTVTSSWTVPAAGPQQEYISIQAVAPSGSTLLLSGTITAPIFL